MAAENLSAARRVFEEAWGDGKLEAIDAVHADDFVGHDPVRGDHPLEGSRELIATYREALPDLEMTVEDVFAADDKVVVRWSATGTFEHEIMGQSPTGERGERVGGITILRFEGGRIAEAWTQWDVLQFMKNIRALPQEVGAAAA